MKAKTTTDHHSILKKAEDFHGHLGPFLVIGVRMGLGGLGRLDGTNENPLAVTASLPLRVPFSCIVDGLQITTHCTTGNQKLRLKDSPKVEAQFERKGHGKKVVVALNQTILETLKAQLTKKKLQDDELRELAWEVASIPESELLAIY